MVPLAWCRLKISGRAPGPSSLYGLTAPNGPPSLGGVLLGLEVWNVIPAAIGRRQTPGRLQVRQGTRPGRLHSKGGSAS